MTGQLHRVDVTVLPAGWTRVEPEIAGNSSPTLSPDGRHMAYVSDRGGAPAVWVQPVGSELTFRVDVPMTVARAATAGTPTPPEEVAADTEFTLSNGDAAFFPGSMGGEMRNDGTEEATAWMVDVTHLTEAPATPTP